MLRLLDFFFAILGSKKNVIGSKYKAPGDASLLQDLEGRPRSSRMPSNARNKTGVPSLERLFREASASEFKKRKKKET